MKLSFSGHESFICKQFWLKKAFDFTQNKKTFNDETAVIDLGVGKNMVASLRFWGRAFGILKDDDTPTEIANYLFSKNGKDQFLEDYGTVWLLHYLLIKNNKSSIYNFVFNEFRKERIDFTKEQLHQFLKRKCEELYPNAYNVNTINSDINVFLRNYIKPQKDEKFEIEDDFSGLLIELDLIKNYKQRDEDNKIVNWYKIEAQDRIDLPYQIVLYSILDNYPGQKTISFRELLSGRNSPGISFLLNTDGLYNKLIQITDHYRGIIYTETAGNRVLQFKSNFNAIDILNEYYG
ncbi:MAG: DUF4007 family protein [Bacteroidetes bacterium]|nr:DUF4007 family protein [Bacteroidota bacterium]MBK9800915.1 DUF4007 family protein [Bacteroidota bacterium]MBP6412468.1 DUF4007 family protein [Bacteroidia bacterium]